MFYGWIGGILIFLGKKVDAEKHGNWYLNRKTGKRVYITFIMHLRKFANEDTNLAAIMILAFYLSFILLAFLCYHLNMARKNTGTNEGHKTSLLKSKLEREGKVFKTLLEECDRWTPESEKAEDQKMPIIKIDGVEMPELKVDRIKKFEEM